MGQTVGQPSAAWPPIRIFRGDDSTTKTRAPCELSPAMTLVDFFQEYAWPDVLQPKGDTEATRKDYVSSLTHWARLTGNPAIAAITDRTCATFLRLLAGLPGLKPGKTMSANTIRKHSDNVGRLLEWVGPRGRWNRRGTNLIPEPAWLEKPAKEFPLPKLVFTLDELWDWLSILPEAARPMPHIKGLDPVAWWWALILLTYNTGMRPGTVFRICWEMLEGHTLRVPVSAIKGQHGRTLWLNDAALEAIQPLRRPSGLILGWAGWPAADSTLKKHRERIQLAAGIRPLSLYGLRRAFATQCVKISVIAAELMMGHEGLSTKMLRDHYLDHEDVLSDALSKMPQPGAVRQKTLFS